MEQAYALDAKNGNKFWVDAISKEMEKVRMALKVLPDGPSIPIGNRFVQCHMVFNIKMENIRQKARLMTGGHMTEAPTNIKYVNVVSRKMVRIALMIATLNDLEVKLGNILNAYVQEPVRETVWTTLDPEFGRDTGKTAVIVIASYSLKSG